MGYNKKGALINNINAIKTAFKIKEEDRIATESERLAVDADPLFLRKSLSRKESYF